MGHVFTLCMVMLSVFSSLAAEDERREEVLAKMTFDFGSPCGIYATGNSHARVVSGGCGDGSRGALEVYSRTEKWNSGEFNLTGRVNVGTKIRFAADVKSLGSH